MKKKILDHFDSAAPYLCVVYLVACISSLWTPISWWVLMVVGITAKAGWCAVYYTAKHVAKIPLPKRKLIIMSGILALGSIIAMAPWIGKQIESILRTRASQSVTQIVPRHPSRELHDRLDGRLMKLHRNKPLHTREWYTQSKGEPPWVQEAGAIQAELDKEFHRLHTAIEDRYKAFSSLRPVEQRMFDGVLKEWPRYSEGLLHRPHLRFQDVLNRLGPSILDDVAMDEADSYLSSRLRKLRELQDLMERYLPSGTI